MPDIERMRGLGADRRRCQARQAGPELDWLGRSTDYTDFTDSSSSRPSAFICGFSLKKADGG
jgi:hypothetical protein